MNPYQIRYTLALFLALLSAAVATSTTAAAGKASFDAPVVSVSDGDTFTIKHCYGDHCQPERIRLHYVDAPEVAKNRKEVNQPGGIEAKEFLTSLLKGKVVKISVVSKSYDRYVCDVTVGGRDAALSLVQHGHAMCDKRFKPTKELLDAEAEAKKNKVGQWKLGTPIEPKDWRAMSRIEQRKFQ